MSRNLDTCKKTRAIASNTLATTLKTLFSTGDRISETRLAKVWLEELRRNPGVFSDGWYAPPPHGIGVLFGTASRMGRQNYYTLRSKEMWPKEDIYLDKDNEMGYFYASPVDCKTGIIGDFGLTIYIGNKPEVKDHLKTCMYIVRKIFNRIEVGMKFSDAFVFAEQIVASYGMVNGVTSTTGPTGKDFGHTVPATYFDWTANEQAVLENGNADGESVKNMISSKRVFVNSVEEQTFQPGMAVTLEPKLTVVDNAAIPMGSFHTIVFIHDNGSKELVTNFDEVFKIVGMDYMM